MRINARKSGLALTWLTVMTLLLSIFGALPAHAAVIDVPADYTTIQAAVNAASAGDTINVAAGTYTENVTVNTANLTLQSVTKCGADIQGNIVVGADGVTIDGFSIQPSSGVAVDVNTAGNVTVKNNCIVGKGPSGSVHGIDYSSSAPGDSGTITDNTVEDCSRGIYMDHDGLTDFVVTGNMLDNNRLTIGFGSLCGGTIENNLIHNSTQKGVEVFDATTSEAHNNCFSGNAKAVVNQDGSNTFDAENNYWGCADGPGGSGCDTNDGSVDSDPYLDYCALTTTMLDATPYAYDETIPRGVDGDAPSGWGDSCWQGPAAGSGNKSNYHVWYTEVTYGGAVDLEDLFGAGHGLTVGDLDSISYHTKKDSSDFTATNKDDWWLSVYTIEEGDGDDSGSWYDSRLHARPDSATGQSASFTLDQWNLWSTDAGASTTNQLLFRDSKRSAWSGYYETLANLAAGPVDWDGDSTDDHDYSGEELKSITLQTDSGWNGFDGYIDGLTIELKDGSIGKVNLIDGPEMGVDVGDPGWLATCEDETITVDILLTANGFNGVEFDLDFNETRLEATGISMGSMWPSGATNPQHTVDNTNGVVEFGAYLQEADTNISVTDGQVAQITFKERNISGNVALDVNDVIVSNSEGQALDVSIEDGTLEVKGCGCVEGVVELQGRFGPDWDDADVSLSSGPGGTYGPETSASNGYWQICDVVEGDYDIDVVMYRYLDAEKTGVAVTDGGNTDVGQVKLLGGDCNDTGTGGNPNPAGAGYIDAGDASIVAGQFGLSTITDVRADINDDAAVNILDCSILGGNWHKTGPISW